MLDPAEEASLTVMMLMIDLEFWKKPPASRPCLVLAGMHPAQSRAGLIP
jgi:hypothetical protein